MRPSKYDKYIFLVCLVLFLYSFFIVGIQPVTKKELVELCYDRGEIPPVGLLKYDDDEIVKVEYPTSIIIAPLVCLMFFCFMVFEKELLPVDRHLVFRKIKDFKKHFMEKIQEGINEFYDWRNNG